LPVLAKLLTSPADVAALFLDLAAFARRDHAVAAGALALTLELALFLADLALVAPDLAVGLGGRGERSRGGDQGHGGDEKTFHSSWLLLPWRHSDGRGYDEGLNGPTH
jgi:hypothetical protein